MTAPSWAQPSLPRFQASIKAGCGWRPQGVGEGVGDGVGVLVGEGVAVKYTVVGVDGDVMGAAANVTAIAAATVAFAAAVDSATSVVSKVGVAMARGFDVASAVMVAATAAATVASISTAGLVVLSGVSTNRTSNVPPQPVSSTIPISTSRKGTHLLFAMSSSTDELLSTLSL
jgi:hypothetical protein